MLKRVSAIALTVAMLLSMACTFSFASAAEPMSLRVEFANKEVGRGETVKASIFVDHYVPCAFIGVRGSFDTAVFNASFFDVSKITMEPTGFKLGDKSSISDGAFFLSAISADEHYADVNVSENSFKLATVELQLNSDYFTTTGELTVNFYADQYHMATTDETKVPTPGAELPDEAFVALDPALYTTAADKDSVSLASIADKMAIVLKDAPATVVRGEEFTVTVAASNYKALASYGFDLNYDDTVLEYVGAEMVLRDNQAIGDLIIPGTDYVRVIKLSADNNLGQNAAEQDLAKVTFRVRKNADLDKSAGLNANFVIKAGTDDNTLAYYISGHTYPVEMVPGHEFTATPSVANTKVVANDHMMALEITADVASADRGDFVVLDVNLKDAVPFSGMDVYIPVDDAVFEVETVFGAAAYVDANIVDKAGKKVIHLMVVNSANMNGVADLATLTLKVKDTAPFGKTKLENAVIAMATENAPAATELVLDADYVNPANLIEVEIVCYHSEGFDLISNNDGTHNVDCKVPGCPYLVENVPCTPTSASENHATCTAPGYYTYTCACAHTWTVANGEGALGHDLKTVHTSGVSTDSMHTITCSRGDYTVTEPCSFVETVVTPPTCLKEGESVATCTGCGFSYKKYPVKLAHTKTKIRFYSPTDAAAGKWSYYCDICKDWPAANDEILPAGHPFKDVTNATAWYYKGVQYAKLIGVMTGADNKGNPDNPITRAEVATILVRYLGYEVKDDAMTDLQFETYLNNLYAQTGVERKELKDLKSGEWYYRACMISCALGIFKGTDEGMFNPGKNITRQEFCVVLHRQFKDSGLKVKAATTYNDAATIADWAKEAVRWSGEIGLFGGDEKKNFNAGQNATRSQVAELMMRIDSSLRNIEIM